MNTPDYEPESRITRERVTASIIVVGLAILAFAIGDLILSIRAFLFFMMPLTMIWLPDILVRVATLDAQWNRHLEAPASAFSIRLIAWVVIIGVPAAWVTFSLIVR